MARIRSIKPEFATDGDMKRLSDSCALFFILLWTHCDDEGKHKLDLDQLVAELGGRWHRGKVKLFLSCLIKSGQLRINSDSTWIQVTGWSHQKIDKPKQPQVKSSELQWVTETDSTTPLEQSREIDARIGSDRIDRIGSDLVPARSTKPARRVANDSEKELNRLIWESYRNGYLARYKVEPIRNASVNSKISQLAKRLGTEAISVVEFYLQHPKSIYVSRLHDVGLCLADAEALHTQMKRGKAITNADVRNFEQSHERARLQNSIQAGEI